MMTSAVPRTKPVNNEMAAAKDNDQVPVDPNLIHIDTRSAQSFFYRIHPISS